MPIRRIAVFAAAWAYNLGDEAIVLAEVSYLRERYPNAAIAVCTYDSESTLIPEDWRVSYFSYFPHAFRKRPFANLGYFFATVLNVVRSDLVVIWGGGILYDNEGQSFRKQRFEWSLRARMAAFFQKKILFWGIGVDVGEANAPLLRSVFPKSATVTVRDPKSEKILKSVGIPAVTVPDPAFLFPVPKVSLPRTPSVGISLRKGYLKGGDDSVRAIVAAVRSRGFEPVFLNQSFHPGNPETDDRAYLEDLSRELGVRSTASLSESLSEYAAVSAVIAMRLHAGVLAFDCGIPAFMLSYSKKTDAFAERAWISFVLPSKDFDPTVFDAEFEKFAKEIPVAPAFFAPSEKCGRIKEEARTSYDETFYGLERD